MSIRIHFKAKKMITPIEMKSTTLLTIISIKVSLGLTCLLASASYARKVINIFILHIEMSFKDDLESLGYLIVYMITGSVPWKI